VTAAGGTATWVEGETMDERAYLSRLTKLYGPLEGDGYGWSDEEREWNRLRNQQLGDDWELPDISTVRRAREEFLNEELIDPILASLPRSDRDIIRKVPVGLLAIRTLNAAVRSPNGKPVIVLNQGLLAIVSFWWEILASWGVIRDEQGPEEAERYLGQMYCFLLNFYVNNGQEQYPRRFVRVKPEWMTRCLKNSIQTEMFVLAHEVSHILAGHLSARHVHTKALQENTEFAEFYQLSHSQEYEADYRGLQLYLEAWPRSPTLGAPLASIDVVTPLNFFAIQTLFEVNVRNPDAFLTHPPAIQRLVRLLSPVLREDLAEGHIELRNDAIQLIEYTRSMPDMSEFLVSAKTNSGITAERWQYD
jgi:hypothetical protein